MVRKRRALRVGDRVTVPWGANEDVPGRVIEVWGDPAEHVRVELHFEGDDPEVLLMRGEDITRAP